MDKTQEFHKAVSEALPKGSNISVKSFNNVILLAAADVNTLNAAAENISDYFQQHRIPMRIALSGVFEIGSEAEKNFRAGLRSEITNLIAGFDSDKGFYQMVSRDLENDSTDY